MNSRDLQNLTKDELIELLIPLLEKQNSQKKKIESEEHKEYRRQKNREYYERKKLKNLINNT